MDISIIQTLISTVGFPIAMCLAMAWFITHNMKTMSSAVDEMKKALDNNTHIMERLLSKLEDE